VQVAEVLRPVLGIAARAAVAHADVEPPVGAERELAAVVVAVRVVEEGDAPLGGGVRGQPARAVLDHALVSVPVGVLDVVAAVPRVVRVEGDRQQALLAAGSDAVANIEEGRVADAAVLDDADPAALLHDVEPVGLGAGRVDVDGRAEAASDRHDPQSGPLTRSRSVLTVVRRPRAAADNGGRDGHGHEVPSDHAAEPSHPIVRGALACAP
jgi:hypothetical protein